MFYKKSHKGKNLFILRGEKIYEIMLVNRYIHIIVFVLLGSTIIWTACTPQKEQAKPNSQAQVPNIPTCHNTEDPFSVDWLKVAWKKHQPESITKYAYRTNGWAYFFQGKTMYLYDCQGTLVCEARMQEAKDCLQFVEDRGKGLVIWQGEGAID